MGLGPPEPTHTTEGIRPTLRLSALSASQIFSLPLARSPLARTLAPPPTLQSPCTPRSCGHRRPHAVWGLPREAPSSTASSTRTSSSSSPLHRAVRRRLQPCTRRRPPSDSSSPSPPRAHSVSLRVRCEPHRPSPPFSAIVFLAVEPSPPEAAMDGSEAPVCARAMLLLLSPGHASPLVAPLADHRFPARRQAL